MRLASRTVVTLAAVGALSGVAAAPAFAAPSATTSTLSATQVAAARCHYSIVGTNVRVRSGPGTSYSIVRVKQNGEQVTGPALCQATVYANGYWWVKLYLGTGGYGWTAEPYLHYIGYY